LQNQRHSILRLQRSRIGITIMLVGCTQTPASSSSLVLAGIKISCDNSLMISADNNAQLYQSIISMMPPHRLCIEAHLEHGARYKATIQCAR
jgi:hypothetical protein